MEANGSFIEDWAGFNCNLCGRYDREPSRVVFAFSHGSRYDGDRMVLQLCGECADRLWEAVPPWAEAAGGCPEG